METEVIKEMRRLASEAGKLADESKKAVKEIDVLYASFSSQIERTEQIVKEINSIPNTFLERVRGIEKVLFFLLAIVSAFFAWFFLEDLVLSLWAKFVLLSESWQIAIFSAIVVLLAAFIDRDRMNKTKRT